MEGSREEKGLNGRVGGFAEGCAANGFSARRRKGPIPPLTLRVESFLLSPLWGSLAFLFGRGGGGLRQEAWERCLHSLPHRVSGFEAPVMAIS